jgi:hypothetical protein
VVARRVGQAYRSHNIALRDAGAAVRRRSLRLAYLRADTLRDLDGNRRRQALSEAALFVSGARASHIPLLEQVMAERWAADAPTFVGCEVAPRGVEVITVGYFGIRRYVGVRR